jgi:hypothetical protein
MPIEERCEALEELEKTTRDSSRLLSQTDNISLLKSGDLEIVRVGRAQLTEESWWRYGREMQRRRKMSYVLAGAEVAIMGLIAVASGGSVLVGSYTGGGMLSGIIKHRKFGSNAWQGVAPCIRCGWNLTRVKFSKAGETRLMPGKEGSPLAIGVECRNCRKATGPAGHFIDGVAAEHMLRRVLAHRHFEGASEKRVREATDMIALAGSPADLTRTLAGDQMRIKDLGAKKNRARSIAVEIAVNEENERKLLELELSALESRWREEEEIAAIVDGELTTIRTALPPSVF